MLVVNIAVILGYLVHQWITSATTIKVPLFVPCLIMGMVLSNTVPKLFPRWPWPARTASLDLISSYSLSVFLAMSLMSMQLWTLAKDCWAAACYRGGTDAAGSDIYLARDLSCTWEGLSGCGAERWVHRHIAWLNADGHRSHDGGHQAARTIAQRFRYSAAGISFVCQSGQCRRDYVVFISIDADNGQVGGNSNCSEDWVGGDNPVRVVDVLWTHSILADLGFCGVDPQATGRPVCHPSVLLKLTSTAISAECPSSRRLEPGLGASRSDVAHWAPCSRSRADEPHPQGGDGAALSLRQPRSASAAPRRVSSTPTTSASASRH